MRRHSLLDLIVTRPRLKIGEYILRDNDYDLKARGCLDESGLRAGFAIRLHVHAQAVLNQRQPDTWESEHSDAHVKIDMVSD